MKRWLTPGRARTLGLLAGLAADVAFRDPQRWHPVAGFGKLANRLERLTYRDRRADGVAHIAILVGLVLVSSVLAERATRRRPMLRLIVTGVGTWTALCGTSLRHESRAILEPFAVGDFETVRSRMPRLFFGFTPDIQRHEILIETITTLTENSLDAEIAPFFWGAVAGMPGVLTYRAINVMDGKIGYHTDRYRNFGWAAARLDDFANWIPARLAALAISAGAWTVDGSATRAMSVFASDAKIDPSPNSGAMYAAFSGALGIRLSRLNRAPVGPATYTFGNGDPPTVDDAMRAIRLSRVAGLLSIGSALVLAGVGRAVLRRLLRRT